MPAQPGDFNNVLREFDAKHEAATPGLPPIYDGGLVLFASGATRENHWCGCLYGLPADPRERARNIVKYHTIVTSQAETEFQRAFAEAKMALNSNLASAVCGIPIPQEQIDYVKRLKAIYDAANARLEAAQVALGKLTVPAQNRDADHDRWLRELNEKRSQELTALVR